ncbi:MAG: hypothetical protein QOF60_1968 [Actinomycetota bacterium]|jgi:hypothetical protein|nr:hypothetical protein [Actinomycetota bacterium]
MANEAGYAKFSLGAVLAGCIVAAGTFGLLLAVAGGVLAAFGMDTNTMNPADWRQLGISGGIAACLGMLAAYLFGGYVAGRMARRRGAAHGFGVFLLNTVAAVGLVGIAGWQMGSGPVLDAMRRNGIPTGWAAWNDVAPWVAGGALVAMLVGAIVGGRAGERWHHKVADVIESEIDLRDRDREPVARGEHYAIDEDEVARVLH